MESQTRRTPDPDMPGNREILALAVPALASLAAEPLLGLVDTAMIGRLGPAALAALGAANPLIGLVITTLIFLEYGTTARLARRFGRGEMALLSQEAVQMGWIATLLGIAVTALLVLIPETLLRLVGVEGEVLAAAAQYLRIRAIGSVPALWVLAGHGVFRGLQDTRTPLGIVVGMNVVNAILDVILIFGWRAAGIPAFGIAGAAAASAAASWIGGLLFVAVLAKRLDLRGVGGGLRPRWGVLREMLGIARDLLLRTLALRAALLSGTRAAAVLGTSSLAAHQVGFQLWIFLALLLDSLAIAGQALIGRMLGAGLPAQARAVGNRLNLWGVVLGIVLAALFFVLREPLPRLFTQDPAVLAALDSIFPLLALMQIPNAILFVLDGLLIGASDMRFIRDSMIALGLLGVVTAWVGGVIFGSLFGVWVGLAVLMLARLWVMGARWRGGKWEGGPGV